MLTELAVQVQEALGIPRRAGDSDFARAPERTAIQERPCYAVHLIRPFVEVLADYQGIPIEVIGQLKALDPDDRIPITAVHEMLQLAVALTKDPDLGLKAAERYRPGDFGAVDYLMSTSATVKDGIETAARYMRIINSAFELRLEETGERAVIRFENDIVLPRAATDYQAATFFRGLCLGWSPNILANTQVFLPYAVPADRSVYERVFSPAAVHFGAPFLGISFDRDHLAAPMQRSDSRLHSIIGTHVERMLADLPTTKSFTKDVRDLLANELSGGNPSATHIAAKLGMSGRTLVRRLEKEGTTFKDLLDDLRKRLALQYVAGRDLRLSEVALLLGFSQTPTFHRAFRRWTGQTPAQYRGQAGAANFRRAKHEDGDAPRSEEHPLLPQKGPARVVLPCRS